MSNKDKFFNGSVLLMGFVYLMFVLAGGMLIYQFLKYRNVGLAGLHTTSQAVVAIKLPQAFSQASEGIHLSVKATSNGFRPLVSTELWGDGIWMGLQAAPTRVSMNNEDFCSEQHLII